MPLAGRGGDGHIGLHTAVTGPVTVGFGTAAARVAVIATKATATPRRATVGTPEAVRPAQRARVRHAFTIIGPPTREFVVRIAERRRAENSERVLARAMHFSTHSVAHELCLRDKARRIRGRIAAGIVRGVGRAR